MNLTHHSLSAFDRRQSHLVATILNLYTCGASLRLDFQSIEAKCVPSIFGFTHVVVRSLRSSANACRDYPNYYHLGQMTRGAIAQVFLSNLDCTKR